MFACSVRPRLTGSLLPAGEVLGRYSLPPVLDVWPPRARSCCGRVGCSDSKSSLSASLLCCWSRGCHGRNLRPCRLAVLCREFAGLALPGPRSSRSSGRRVVRGNSLASSLACGRPAVPVRLLARTFLCYALSTFSVSLSVSVPSASLRSHLFHPLTLPCLPRDGAVGTARVDFCRRRDRRAGLGSPLLPPVDVAAVCQLPARSPGFGGVSPLFTRVSLRDHTTFMLGRVCWSFTSLPSVLTSAVFAHRFVGIIPPAEGGVLQRPLLAAVSGQGLVAQPLPL